MLAARWRIQEILDATDPKNVKAGGDLLSSGNSAQIGSSGDYAQIGSSGDYAQIGSSGNYAQIEASGKKSIIVAFGYKAIAKAGDDGCIALAWWDEKRPRLAVGYVGEGLKADTWYRVENGVLVEAK